MHIECNAAHYMNTYLKVNSNKNKINDTFIVRFEDYAVSFPTQFLDDSQLCNMHHHVL